MADLFAGKADDYDARPVPAQISSGVFAAIDAAVSLDPEMVVMDFGAGTGLIAGKIAPRVARVLAVDVSEAMLARLTAKPELKGKVEPICQNLLDTPLEQQVDLIVSAMAMHHVQDIAALTRALFAHLKPGGRVALADLDTEQGDFHPPGMEGVFHAGFDRAALGGHLADAGFVNARFVTACDVTRDGRRYPVFLVVAERPSEPN